MAIKRAVEALVPDAGLRPTPDSEQHMRAELERLQPRGHGKDPLAEAYPLGRDVVEAIEWRDRAEAPDLVGELRRQLLERVGWLQSTDGEKEAE